MPVFRPRADGIEIFVRLTPKSSRDEISGTEQTADGAYLRARVRAAPERGKANRALLRLLAAHCGVPVSGLSLTSGDTARLKRILIRAGEREAARIAALLEGEGSQDLDR